jgi:hypothetical protein
MVKRMEGGQRDCVSDADLLGLVQTLTSELAAQRSMIRELRRIILHLGMLLGANGSDVLCDKESAIIGEADISTRARTRDELKTAKLMSTDRVRYSQPV